VSTALDVMAEEGLTAVSFRSVSSRLGVNPMALYTYVRDKDELLACMYNRAVQDLPLDEMSTESPVDQIVGYYVAARRMLFRNADLYRLVPRGVVPHMPVDNAERLCRLLSSLGLDAHGVAALQSTLLQFTIGNALYWHALAPAGVATEEASAATAAIAELDPDTYPHLRAMSNVMAAYDVEAEFTAALRGIIEKTIEETL